MTKYDFDKLIDRHNTYSTQWDYISDRFGHDDILPFSISDTDFAVPKAVQTALIQRIQHPIYGYTRWNHPAFKDSIVKWFEADSRVKIDSDWIVYSPSVIYTLATLIRMHSQPGDTVATFTPMYDAFFGAIESNHRVLAPIRLSPADQDYRIDWDSLALILAQTRTKIFILTNPHNPTGKVFTPAELTRLYELCQAHNVYLISDDIHRDIIYPGMQYTPITMIGLKNVALLCSGSKTFNTPGLIGSYALLPDEPTRSEFLIELKQRNALSSVSIMGMTAQMAAYNESRDYVEQLVAYLDNNMRILDNFIKKELPLIKFTKPQATYLAWLNVSALNLSSTELQQRLTEIGKIGIMPGETYGDSTYLRMNIACPVDKLMRGLEGLKKAIGGS
ncbi:PatB family C-S lyase [Periweissella fabaria]|uniref:cysteine-S-conjugate beta-lyase n=1 Tax=Periweissella fabaria TaxID=546157 RepID=A0ABM8Z3Y9_9LACO|nr:PatB family C-S lyase [Periweissella fabaria]MCM0598043.1 PatB family C-S lyase [Periweissella fabaria]CAH0415894.1 Protein MalY [Periweissella fabaria]